MNRQTIAGLRRQDRFARWAPQYENGEVMSRLLAGLQTRAAAMLHLGPDDRFLDVGCATGAAVRVASATVELALGVDSSAAMIQRARALAAARPRAAFVVADAQQLPFRQRPSPPCCAAPRFVTSPMRPARQPRWSAS